jgi:hypothetical protein
MSTAARRKIGPAAFVVVLTTLISLAFVGSYAGALHEPGLHEVPIAVADGVPAPLVDALGGSSALSVRRVATPAQARRSIDRRAAYAAITTAPGGLTLVVAPAASAGIATLLAAQLRPVLLRAGGAVRVSTVHPLPSADHTGNVGFYAVVGWVIAGYLGATLLGAAFGAHVGRRQTLLRISTLMVLAVIVGYTVAAVAFAIGGLPGSLLAVGAIGLLTVLSVGTITVALQSLLGPIGSIVAMLVFVILGNPASGGPAAPELLPWFWRLLGQHIPVGAGTTAFRDAVYFPDASLTGPLLTLTIWLVVGAVVAVAFAERRPGPSTTEAAATVVGGMAP